MLKIKDNIDLKELEKFGFAYIEKSDESYERYEIEVETDFSFHYLFVLTCDRELIGNYPDIVYDLIKANLVEKV